MIAHHSALHTVSYYIESHLSNSWPQKHLTSSIACKTHVEQQSLKLEPGSVSHPTRTLNHMPIRRSRTQQWRVVHMAGKPRQMCVNNQHLLGLHDINRPPTNSSDHIEYWWQLYRPTVTARLCRGKMSNDTNRRAVSLRQLSFLLWQPRNRKLFWLNCCLLSVVEMIETKEG